MSFRKILAGAVCASVCALGAMSGAMAQDAGGMDLKAGNVLVRGRLIAVLPDVSSTISTIGGKVAATDAYVPEVDFSYFLTDQISAELIAATTRHGIRANGTAAGNLGLGSVWLLPPTLLLQWHPMPKAVFSPYIGAGVNYTFFYNAKSPGGLINSVSYKNNAGYAFQAGFDYALKGPWFANVDVKKLFLNTTANVNHGLAIAKVDLDPLIVGVGFGYKF